MRCWEAVPALLLLQIHRTAVITICRAAAGNWSRTCTRARSAQTPWQRPAVHARRSAHLSCALSLCTQGNALYVPCAVPHMHASNIESPRQASQPRMHPEARGMLCRRTCDLSFTYRAKYHRFCSGDVSSPSRISTSTLCRTRPRLRALRMKPEMPSSALPAREACPKPALNTPHAGAKICNSKHGLHTRKLLQLRQSQPFGLTNKACAQAQ